ncbi:sirohydrochlorin chelatase [Xinfangfangia pollutisoli]|uniref:sirohydrochlorin chelatase n=1 Tax=Xinfangfangia pollutisoli TaxID=2865960 RepID=UPI001CD5F616|nr:CbiX/SirB N-terminal domain-containing protein [Xinfangfangia pollutisoli]
MSSALIVAHGQPSDPQPASAALQGLAARVAALLPGWQVGAATLAEPGALARAAAAQPPGRIFPLFMAGGWFTRAAIPARLAEAGVTGWQMLEPFGCDPAVHDLALRIVAEQGGGEVLLAAHGSFKSPVPAAIAQALARRIGAETGCRAEAAFIDQAPRLAQARGWGAGALCLPFFAMAGGHVETDLPAALAEAGFAGAVLPPLGLDPRVPGLIAAALRQPRSLCGSCRFRGD